MVTLNKDSLRQWQEGDMEPIRYAYDLLPEDTVLDIGSYRREWGGEIEKRYGCKVEYFDALDNRAAWTHDGVLKMGGAFYYTSAYADQKHTDYKCVDIAPFLQREVALVKMNIEGGEYFILDYMLGKGLINNIINIQVQFHLIEGMNCEANYKDLASRLCETHELTWRYPFCWENWQRKDYVRKTFQSC